MEQSPSKILQARNQNQQRTIVRNLLAASLVVCAVLITTALFSSAPTSEIIIRITTIMVVVGIIAITYLFVRNNQLFIASHIIMWMIIVPTFATYFFVDPTSMSIVAFVIPLILTSLLLPEIWTYVYTGVVIIIYLVIQFIVFKYELTPNNRTRIVSELMYFVSFGIGLGFSARRMKGLFGFAVENTQRLEESQANLEVRVQERTASLQAALEEVQTSSETIKQLTVPLLRIADGVLLLPLLGTITANRAEQIEQQVLNQAYADKPHTVLIDMTGISNVTPEFIQKLLKLVTSLHLLGIRSVLVGIHADLATTFIEQTNSLSNLTIKRDVQQGLAYAMSTASYSNRI